jgi:hypothetical protein
LTSVQIKTNAGEVVAEWVMKHRTELSMKYVIWGQKIWETDTDTEVSWSSWKSQGDKGSNTANHWCVPRVYCGRAKMF